MNEEVTAHDLPVTGRIPAGLNGRYLRNGPNPLGHVDPATHHWMLGEGMVHGVRLRDGRAAWYRNRWVRAASVAEKLGEPRRGRPLQGDMDFATNTHVIGHAGRTFALMESGPPPYELTDELDTIGPSDFGGTLPAGFTAHPKLDPRTGELHAIAYLPGGDHVQHLVVDATGKVIRATSIPAAGHGMMHDFSLTERHVIVYDLPLTFSMEALGAGQAVPYVFRRDRPARIGIMPRAGGEVRWREAEPCWIAHTLNAYDDGSSVIIDLVRYPGWFDASEHRAAIPVFDRWTLDLASDKVHERRLDDRPQEFPRVNEGVVSRPHRYGYTAVMGALIASMAPLGAKLPGEAFTNALLKHDLVRGTSEIHSFGRDAAVGEGVFAPSASSTSSAEAAEDDGYVMAYVHNPDRGAADLVILAAQDFTGEPVARIHLPTRIPLGFHGSWIPDA
ncbi:Lignostilbene-alpha,beta-dioxygenase [Chondromyces apiculatus DSM 436]|uniref:Lignostilbene-alpha,beta-dioxygenase n=1 Tax=Chondromyces apiculatus DSM 436 TaxID=1192034 RepID=A0A017TGU2_9BACT|nr:Lignostilbene-alpha,beta-dioxygenase [Chondromyces apiculatus DSM 436]